MGGSNWAAWGAVVGLGFGLGCGGASHERGPSGGASGAAGAPAIGMGGSPGGGGGPVANGGAGGAAGAPVGVTSPSPFLSPGASFAPGSFCETDGWCWYDPRPSGDWWMALAGAGAAEVWIGGMSGTALHFVPGAWSAVVSPLSITEGIWAAAANDVWFGGTSGAEIAAIAHWDGQSITLTGTFGSGEINDVWGSGPNDVYAVGFGTVQHWNGQTWSTVAGVLGSVVSGSGPSDVWIGSDVGLQHFDGTSWTAVPQFAGQFLLGVADAAPNDVWAVALHDGVQDVEHFDGTAWTISLHLDAATTTNTPLHNIVIGAGGAGDVWLAGTQFPGPSSSGVAGQGGYLAHFDGTSWTVAPETPTPMYRVNGTRGFGDLAVGQGGGILTLTSLPTVGFTVREAGPSQSLTGVWGSSPMDMWAVGAAGTALHFDGTTIATLSTGVITDLTDVWGTGPDDVWIVGRGGTVLHFDGQMLSPVPTGMTADLLAVFTAAAGDVWVGGESTLAHFDGTSFQAVPLAGLTGPFAVFDLHGLGAGDVWLSGGPSETLTGGPVGFVAHFDGSAWSPADLLTASAGGFPMRRIWELAPTDVWAMTQPTFRGLVDYWHFDGTTWTDEQMAPSPTTFMFPDPQDALGSFVFGPHDLWMVGAFGAWERNTQ